MIKNIKLKNNKGISLVSVIVTIIVMLVILTSIVFSTNRTNEIKRAMLINSDIEELTKKVEVYYLEKETLPVDEDENYQYPKSISELSEDEFKETPVYSRLQISLLDNVTLNNKEELPNQWYVINPETHTIYFVKKDASKLVIQDAQYSSKYETLINNAKVGTGTGRINFNQTMTSPTTPGGDITLSYQDDVLRDDPNSIDYEMLYGDQGPDTGPNAPTLPTSTANYSYKDYIGWNEAGTTATNLVLQYDGEYNAGRTGTYHNGSATTWVNLVNPGTNNCNFIENRFSYKYHDTTKQFDTAIDISKLTEDTYTLGFRNIKEDLSSRDTLLYDFWDKANSETMSFGNKHIILSGHTTNGYLAKPSLQFSNTNSYTIEINFDYQEGKNIYLYDFSYLKTATKKTEDYNAGGFTYQYGWINSTSIDTGTLSDFYRSSDSIANGMLTPLNGKNLYKLKSTELGEKATFFKKLVDEGVQNSTYTKKAYTNGNKLYIEDGTSKYEVSISNLNYGNHTISVVYNTSNQINVYIDGSKVLDNKTATSSFSNRRIALFGCNVSADILYLDHNSDSDRLRLVGFAGLWAATFRTGNSALFRCKYANLSTVNFYSVRIYNRVLTNAEIMYNYITDYYRF